MGKLIRKSIHLMANVIPISAILYVGTKLIIIDWLTLHTYF